MCNSAVWPTYTTSENWIGLGMTSLAPASLYFCLWGLDLCFYTLNQVAICHGNRLSSLCVHLAAYLKSKFLFNSLLSFMVNEMYIIRFLFFANHFNEKIQSFNFVPYKYMLQRYFFHFYTINPGYGHPIPQTLTIRQAQLSFQLRFFTLFHISSSTGALYRRRQNISAT
jgi:hypothetical protein